MKKELQIALLILAIVLIILICRRQCWVKKSVTPVLYDPDTVPTEPPVVLPCLGTGVIDTLSHDFSNTPYTLTGLNDAYDNWRRAEYTFNDDTVRTNGGYIFIHPAPADSTPVPSSNSIMQAFNMGVRIINYDDFVSYPNGHATYLPFDGATYQFTDNNPQDCSTAPNQTGEDANGSGPGWTNNTFGVSEWIEASNVQMTDNGTNVDVTWDSIPGVDEYVISLTYTGSVTEYPCFGPCTPLPDQQFYFGSIVPSQDTSVNIVVPQENVQYVGFWGSIQNVEVRVVGYSVCNKSNILQGCAGVYYN